MKPSACRIVVALIGLILCVACGGNGGSDAPTQVATIPPSPGAAARDAGPTVSPTASPLPPTPTAEPVAAPTFVVNSLPVGCHEAPAVDAAIIVRLPPGAVQEMDQSFRRPDGLWHREVGQQCWTRAEPGPVRVFAALDQAEAYSLTLRPEVTVVNGTSGVLRFHFSGPVEEEGTVAACPNCPAVGRDTALDPLTGRPWFTLPSSRDERIVCEERGQRHTLRLPVGAYTVTFTSAAGPEPVGTTGFELRAPGSACVHQTAEGTRVNYAGALVAPTPRPTPSPRPTPRPTPTPSPSPVPVVDRPLTGQTSEGRPVTIGLDAAGNVVQFEIGVAVRQDCGSAGGMHFIQGPLRMTVQEQVHGQSAGYILNATVEPDRTLVGTLSAPGPIAVAGGRFSTPYLTGTFTSPGMASGSLTILTDGGSASVSPPEGTRIEQVPGSTPGLRHCLRGPIRVDWTAAR